MKCRVCVRGFDQDFDPDEIFASTPSLTTLKVLLTLCTAFNWHVIAGDVSWPFCTLHFWVKLCRLFRRQNSTLKGAYFGNLGALCTG